MLTQIDIKGFRSFSQESYQSIKLRPLTVFVGENDTGKSNILKAIDFALNPSKENVVREDFNIRKSKSRRGNIVDKKASKIFIRLHFNNKEKLLPQKFQSRKYKSKNTNTFVIECITSGHDKNSFKKEYLLNEKSIKNNDVKELLSKIKYSVTPTIRDVSYLSTLKELLPITRSSTIKKQVRDIEKDIKNRFKPFEKIYRKTTHSEEINIIPEFDCEKILENLDIKFSVKKEGIPIQLIYHGQGMISKIILETILKKGQNLIIGIEEPEIHMHPNFIRELINKCANLVEKGNQIIIDTHSPYFTSFIPIESIILVKKVNKYTKTTTITPNDQEIAQKIQNDIFLNRQKTEILFTKGVILVEGPYDRQVFTTINTTKKYRIFENGISIIDVGGDSNFGHYIELCKKIDLPWVIIGDKKAFYVRENNDRGPLVKTLEKFIDRNLIDTLKSRMERNLSFKKELKNINDKLLNSKGKIFCLSGNDLSDTIINILNKINSDELYKNLYTNLGHSRQQENIEEIKMQINNDIKNKDYQMARVFETLKQPNELEEILKRALRFLKQHRS